MNKSYKTLLLSAFLVSTLVSCGVPGNILNLNNPIFTGNTQVNPNIEQLKIRDEEDVSELLENCDGPGLLFFYVLDKESDLESKSKLENLFASNFMHDYQGIALDTNDNIASLKDSNKNIYHLYLLSGEKGRSNQDLFQANHYSLCLNSGLNVINNDLNNVVLTPVKDSNGNLCLKLTYDETSTYTYYGKTGDSTETSEGASVVSNTNLLNRFNGKGFISAVDANNASSKDSDYEHIASGDSLIAHFFAAFCISPNSSSDFNNIYWSDLEYMGKIDIGALL